MTTTDQTTDLEGAPGVGFAGCSRRGRLLRVRVADISRRRLRVECPEGCGVHEATDSMARPLRPDEDAPELVELPPTEPAPNQRRGMSDAAFLEAMPGAWTPAADLAEHLRYASQKGLTNRLGHMRRRAEKAGEDPPFESKRGPGNKLMVRRARS